MSPKEQLKEISAQTHELVRSQYSTSEPFLFFLHLKKVGLHLVMEHEKLNEEQQGMWTGILRIMYIRCLPYGNGFFQTVSADPK